MGWLSALVSPISNLVSTIFQGKTDIAKAKIDREVKALSHEANWDTVQAEAGKGSWKDEWLTLLVSVPLIMAFIPSMVPYVEAGFIVLEQMPEWYQYLLGVAFAAAFGVKGATTFMSKLGK